MKVIICGGRNHPPFRADWEIAYLDYLRDRLGITHVLHGDARGADFEGKQWALARDIPQMACPAAWGIYGTQAGPIRNKAMLAMLAPDDAVISFPGGRGTHNMLRMAWGRAIRNILL